jgi:parallel beta-helix repeat protein
MKSKVMIKSLIVGIVIACIGASIGSAYHAQSSISPQPTNRGTLYVGGGGPGNYTTIQAAINNATNGDIIFVYHNTYNENIDTKLKQVTLIAENQANTTINGIAGDATVKIGSNHVTVTGFTINGISPEVVIQVSSLSSDVLISHNLIKNGGYGVSLLATSSRITITDNAITGQTFVGIQLQSSTFDVITENTIENSGGQGITISLNSNHNSLLNNTIINSVKEAIYIEGVGSTVNTISGNNLSANQVGIRFSSAGSNTITSNNIQDSTMEGMLLQTSNDNIVKMNNFIDNKRQATFKLSSRNTWDANYWSNWIGFKLSKPGFQKFPKVIMGIARMNFDWHPAKQPYNITTAL